MTLKELLEQRGVQDVDGILEAMKAEKIFTANEENLEVRYSKLKDQHAESEKKLGEAEKLIEQLKAAGTLDEESKQKIATYDQEVAALKAELAQEKLSNAIKVGLLAEKATDVDYLAYKLSQDKDGLELDENGQVKGWDDKVTALKTAHPNMFEKGKGNPKPDPHKLPDPEGNNVVTKEQFDKMSFSKRAELLESDPETFESLSK